MAYNWKFDKKANKYFSKKIDKEIQKRIISWLNLHIKNTYDPRAYGKALSGSFTGFWRYRVGKYRIIADIKDEEHIVTITKIDKRGDVYKKA